MLERPYYFHCSDRAFDGLLQLITLNLSSNAIKTLGSDAFVGLVSLQEMDLSHNFIEKIDNKSNGVLDNCLSLRKVPNLFNLILNRSNNNLSMISDQPELQQNQFCYH